MPSQSKRQYRARTDDRPESWWEHPDQDGLWDDDRSLVEDELAVHKDLGATNPRLEWREVDDEDPNLEHAHLIWPQG